MTSFLPSQTRSCFAGSFFLLYSNSYSEIFTPRAYFNLYIHVMVLCYNTSVFSYSVLKEIKATPQNLVVFPSLISFSNFSI